MSFSSQGFAPELVKALTECGYEKLTPIQQKAIPMARKGHDIFATAQTGTGKTAAFLLATLNRLMQSPGLEGRKPNQPRALVVAPTRELAQQIAADAKPLCRLKRSCAHQDLWIISKP